MVKKNSVLAAALLLAILVGLVVNSRNIKTQLSYNSDHGFVEPTLANNWLSVPRASSNDNEFAPFEVTDCLKARKGTVDASLYRKLPKPYINLGFPKMGTTTLHRYFECGGLRSTHLKCGRSDTCARCTKRSVVAGLPPLTDCRKADAYAQLDDGVYFPQIELLEEFVRGHPNATFFLTFRSMEKWYHSITHWPPRKNGPYMNDRFKKFNITGSPPRAGKSNQKEFSDWYCNHVTRVRTIMAQNPSTRLVEVDIEDSNIGQRMEDMFGVDKSCWVQANVNTQIHPEVNQSDVIVSKILERQEKDNASRHNKQTEKGSRRRQGRKQNRNDSDGDV